MNDGRHRNEHLPLWNAIAGAVRDAAKCHPDIQIPDRRVASIVKRAVGNGSGMTPTLCSRCGGHKDRCECAVLRREALEGAVADVREYSDLLRAEWTGPRDGTFLAITNALGHARERIRALARNPGPRQ